MGFTAAAPLQLVQGLAACSIGQPCRMPSWCG